MSSKLNKDEILDRIMETLTAGWGPKVVQASLDRVVGSKVREASSTDSGSTTSEEEPRAYRYAQSKDFGPNQFLIEQFAIEFDAGRVLARSSDIQNFLKAHGVRIREIKSRNQAFRTISEVLSKMSRKGVLSSIERARYSGPAKLEEVSDAIGKRASESRRPRS